MPAKKPVSPCCNHQKTCLREHPSRQDFLWAFHGKLEFVEMFRRERIYPFRPVTFLLGHVEWKNVGHPPVYGTSHFLYDNHIVKSQFATFCSF